MSIVTGWRAENAVIDGVSVVRYAGQALGHVHCKWQEVLDDAHAVALKEEADREWVKTQIGDVPHDRIAGLNCHDNPMAWAEFRCAVPVESLGRES